MAVLFSDRVKQNTSTVGKGTIDLHGDLTDFKTFVDGIGDGNQCYYSIVNNGKDEYEIGIGTVTEGDIDTLTRDAVLDSSNSGTLIDFSGGFKDVFVTAPASYISRPLVTQTEIDFGSTPISSKEFTITDSNVSVNSRVTANMAYDAPTGKDLDETEMDHLQIICGQVTVGSFKMYVTSSDGSYLADKFKVNYTI